MSNSTLTDAKAPEIKQDEARKTENVFAKAIAEAENDLFEKQRVSVPLTTENAVFTKGGGGLISLTLKNEDGSEEFFERVVIFRSFPITNPNEFISVREPDSKKMGRGKEIGMIRRLSDFPGEAVDLINSELEKRYFSPEITKIISVKDKFGYLYFDVVTTSGPITFILQNPFHNIRILEDERIFIHDIDGNNFQIPNASALDSLSYKKIEMYL